MLREHMNQALAEKMNRDTYRLSLSAAVFLPLTFITGLLRVNLGGIPGGEFTQSTANASSDSQPGRCVSATIPVIAAQPVGG